jgi:hypothetical protein
MEWYPDDGSVMAVMRGSQTKLVNYIITCGGIPRHLKPRVLADTLGFNIEESEGKPRVSANTLGFRCLGIPPKRCYS